MADESQIKILEKQLNKTTIIIENGGFHISLKSIDELHSIIKTLKEVCEPA